MAKCEREAGKSQDPTVCFEGWPQLPETAQYIPPFKLSTTTQQILAHEPSKDILEPFYSSKSWIVRSNKSPQNEIIPKKFWNSSFLYIFVPWCEALTLGFLSL
jgi:hypothetical protein